MQDLLLFFWGENAASRHSLLASPRVLHPISILITILLLVIVVIRNLSILLLLTPLSRSRMQLKSSITHLHNGAIDHCLGGKHWCWFDWTLRVKETAHFRLTRWWEHCFLIFFFFLRRSRQRALTVLSQLTLHLDPAGFPNRRGLLLLQGTRAPTNTWQAHHLKSKDFCLLVSEVSCLQIFKFEFKL